MGPAAPGPIGGVRVVAAVGAGLGLAVGAMFLMPAVTSLVAGLFADDIAAEVESTYYPDDPPGVPVPLGYALVEAVKTALLALAIYLCCLPFLLVAGLGAVVFFLATAYLLGREYFLIAALRQHPIPAARALWHARRWEIFSAGLLIAAFVLIPIVNLATPLFATAFMVHVHKRLTAEPGRPVVSAVEVDGDHRTDWPTRPPQAGRRRRRNAPGAPAHCGRLTVRTKPQPATKARAVDTSVL